MLKEKQEISGGKKGERRMTVDSLIELILRSDDFVKEGREEMDWRLDLVRSNGQILQRNKGGEERREKSGSVFV